jgi:hypothetical protein
MALNWDQGSGTQWGKAQEGFGAIGRLRVNVRGFVGGVWMGDSVRASPLPDSKRFPFRTEHFDTTHHTITTVFALAPVPASARPPRCRFPKSPFLRGQALEATQTPCRRTNLSDRQCLPQKTIGKYAPCRPQPTAPTSTLP